MINDPLNPIVVKWIYYPECTVHGFIYQAWCTLKTIHFVITLSPVAIQIPWCVKILVNALSAYPSVGAGGYQSCSPCPQWSARSHSWLQIQHLVADPFDPIRVDWMCYLVSYSECMGSNNRQDVPLKKMSK